MTARIQRISVSLSMPSAFGSINVSDNEVAVARLPGLVAWWRADRDSIVEETDGKLRWTDVIGGNVLRTPSTVQPARSEQINGRATLTFTGAEEFDAPDFLVASDAWSIAVLHKLDSAASGLRAHYGPKAAATGTPDVASLAFNAGVARMINSSASSVLVGGTSDHRGAAAFNLTTKSAALGMSIYRDGTLLAAGAGVTSTLDDRSFGVANTLAGSTARYVGHLADILVFDRDYTAAANAASLATLNAVMSDWSGV